MKKRYTSDPKQAFRRNAFTKQFNKIFLALLALLLLGGKMAVGQNLYSKNSFTSNEVLYVEFKTPDTPEGNKFRVRTSTDGVSWGNWWSSLRDGIGNITVSNNATLTIIFNTSTPVELYGQIKINNSGSNGGKLIMKLGDDYNNHTNPDVRTEITLRNNKYDVAYTQGIIFINDLDANRTTQWPLDRSKITILGKDVDNTSYTNDTTNFDLSKQFVIDGNCEPMITLTSSGATETYTVSKKNDTDTNTQSPIFRIQCGTLEMTNVTIQNYWNAYGTGAGGVYVITNNANQQSAARKTSVKVTMNHCWMHHIASAFPGVYMQYNSSSYTGTGDPAPSVSIQNSRFSDIYSHVTKKNSAIRSNSKSLCNLTMNKCSILNNYGGGVRWQSTRPCTATFTNCLVKGNRSYSYGADVSNDPAQGCGGGMIIKSSSTIEGCLIEKNWSQESGGGICFTNFDESTSESTYPEHGNVILDPSTTISENSAQKNGGGIAVIAFRMRNNPYYYGYTNGSQNGQYTMTFNLGGATVIDNTAISGNGGGVYITRAADATFYGITCNLDKGTIQNNLATNGNGGGVCVTQDKNTGSGDLYTLPTAGTVTNIKPQNVVVNMSNTTVSDPMTITSNIHAQKGGGVFVDVDTINYRYLAQIGGSYSTNASRPNQRATTTTTLFDRTLITSNAASDDGGGLYVAQGTVNIDGTSNYPTVTTNSATNDGGGVYVDDGEVRIRRAKILSNTATNGSGGGVYVAKGDVNINYWRADDNVPDSWVQQGESAASEIKSNTAKINGGGIYTHNGYVRAKGKVEGHVNQKIQIHGNTAQTGSGGGIFCYGSDASKTYVLLENVELKNNLVTGNTASQLPVVSGCGGGIYLQTGIIDIAKCNLQGNKAYVNGGGINNHSGSILVKGCLIGGDDPADGNVAGTANSSGEGKGGGIYTLSGDITVTDLQRGSTLYESKIANNKAYYNGGGLNTHEGKITITGTHDNHIEILDNQSTTGSGGGVYCRGTNPATVYIDFTHVDIKNNTAEINGGGIYLDKGKIQITDAIVQTNLAQLDGGGVYNNSGNIDVKGCLIGGDTYYNSGAGAGNKANQSGGGIYTHAGNIDIQDYIDETVPNAILHCKTKISHNEAAQNGGGINTHSGTITVNYDSSTGEERETDHEIEITYNKASKGGGIYAHQGTIIAAKALVDYNEATENGGGINNHSGDITFYGGSLSNNVAVNGKGGGAFTLVGDVVIKPFPVNVTTPTLNNGVKMYNNRANLNGGGVNNHTGRVDLRYATIRNNTSTLGNGGGIFCEGPHSNATGYTIRMLNSQLMHNKTRGQDGTPSDPTGRGGGIYLKYGSIFAQNSQIHENFANINGGGLDNHDGTILVYGCEIKNNRAVTGRGGGIYTQTGNITTGPSLVSGSSNATVIQSNGAHINGGGINNHQGDIFLNGDHILDNTAETGEGGGIYIANGTIDMYGGKIANNTANSGKGGGVYSGGGTFNIQQRQGKPIVEIIDADIISGTSVKVHYHLVDQGSGTLGDPVNSTPAFTSPQEHGIIWGDSESVVENAILGTLGGATQISCTYADMEKSGCYRIPITSGISAGNTYYVKAYAINSESKIDYSDVVAFTTFTTKPTVLTGGVSSITSTGGEGNGKILYDGGSDITKRGVQVWKKAESATDANLIEYAGSETFFTVAFSGLEPNTEYYMRAYASNAATPSYPSDYSFGETEEFKTLKNTPDMGSGPLTVTAMTRMPDGTYNVSFKYVKDPTGLTRYGFVTSTDDDPELDQDNTVLGTEYEDGFIGTAMGLDGATNYYVRAFGTTVNPATNDPTDYTITTPVKFITPDANDKPVVRFESFSGVTRTTARLSGRIVYHGSQSVKRYGVCYSTSADPVPTYTGSGCSHEDLTDEINADNTPFNVDLTGLDPNTTYYLRVFATQSNDNPPAENVIAYGNEYSFTTLPETPPTVEVDVTTKMVSSDSKADVRCVVNCNGDNITTFYIKYVQTGQTDTTTVNYPTSIPSGDIDYTFTIPASGSLVKDVEYKVFAYASNSIGSYKGRYVTFTSTYNKPIPLAPVISGIQFNNTTGHHIATATTTITKGDNDTQSYGLVFGSEQLPTIGRMSTEDDTDIRYTRIENANSSASSIAVTHTLGSRRVNGSADNSGGDYTYNALFSNRRYYVRAYATSKAGDVASLTDDDYTYIPADGETKVTFLTLPNLYKRDYGQITTNSIRVNAEVTSKDPNWYLREKGIIWTTNSSHGNSTYLVYESGEADVNRSSESITEPYDDNHWIGYTITESVSGTPLTANTRVYWRGYVRNYDAINDVYNVAYTGVQSEWTKQYDVTLTTLPANADGLCTGAGSFNSGESCTLTATTSEDYPEFEKWVIGVSNYTDNPHTFTVSGNTAVTAYFKSRVQVVTGNSTFGTVSITSGTGNFSYDASTTVVATAEPALGYEFQNWTINGTEISTDPSLNYSIANVTEAVTITANFVAPTYALTLNVNPVGGGTVSGAGSYPYGESVTITATPDPSYTVVTWTDSESNIVSDDETYVFTMPASALTLTANFITRSGRGNASGASTGSATSASRRSRDIYPAPAREPWDWDEDDCTLNPHGGQGSAIPCAEGSTLRSGDCGSTPAMKGFGAMSTDTLTQPEDDTIAALRERLARTVTPPQDVPLILGNTADYGGGIYMTNDDPANPTTLVFSGGSSASDKGRVILNHANKRGGGIYIDDKAYMQMKGHCEVNYNNVPADSLGGGIFLLGRLYVGSDKDAAVDAHALAVNRNYDVASMGLNPADSANIIADNGSYTPSFTVSQRNNIYLPKNEYHWETGNQDDNNDLSNVITLLSNISGFTYTDTNGNGSYDSGEPRVFYSNIGFSVPRGSCPVIATANGFENEYLKQGDPNFTAVYEPWMTALMPPAGSYNMTNSAVFDDSESYMALHTRVDDEPFRAKYIYLWGCWTNPYVFDDPEIYNPMEGTGSGGEWCEHYKILNPEANTNDPSDPNYNTPLEWEIYSEKGLSWFSSYVNGLNVFKDGDVASGGNHLAYRPEKNPKANAVLKADLDMSEYFWVPIGSVTQYEGINQSNIFTDNEHHNYQGVFDGQGHTVKGIVCRLVTGINKMGLFGHLAGDAKVKNVFIDEAMLIATNPAETYHIGSVAGIMSGNATVSACEARAYINITDAQKATSYAGGLVGKAENGATNVIHSSMALPDITGVVDYMGGLVGYLGTGNFLYNSFSNPHFPKTTDPWYSGMTIGKYIGGLVGVNAGTVENCYSRLQGNEPTSDGSASVFGWLAGDNGGSINYSYAPFDNIYGGGVYKRAGSEPTGHGTYTATERFSGKYGFMHRDQAVTASNNSYIKNDTLTGGLQHALNAWVKDKGKTTYHPWMRTMASTINDDLPILNFLKESGAKALTTNPLYNAVGSKDGMYMDYNTKVDTLLKQYTAIDEVLIYPTPAIYLYDSIMNGAIPDSISYTNIGTTHPNVMLAINENVGILVNGTAASNGLKARVGVTIRNDRTDPDDPNWHLFSSAVAAADAPVGLKYNTDDATTINMSSIDGYSNDTYAANIVNNATKPQHLDNVYGVRQYFDPPKTQWYQSDNSTPSPGEAPYDPDKVGYFPTNTPYGRWRSNTADPLGFFDLYAYSEAHYHWINFKREGSASYMDHWHMDPEFGTLLHHKINYTNEENMPVGKGYLMALSEESMMMTDGVLNTGNKSVTVTHTNTSANTPPAGSVGTYNYNLPWRSLNLIGNPYQSYLDFDLFHDATENADIIDNVYGTREDGIGDYIYYTNGQSSTPFTASKFIHPHQGFFVKKTNGEGSSTLTFTDAMRVAGTSTSLSSPYRNQMNYPLVVLLSYDSNGGRDLTTVEVNRPELGGGGKMHSLRTSNASVYACFEDKDWQTLFTPEGVSEVPVRFEAFEDGEYTFNWETYHGDFSYLHLIDNLAGKDIDCLSANEYKFEGKTTDYHSRFKLVFQCTGVEENTDDATTVNFAFQHEDELIVNGEGQLEMFDITGRRLMNTQAVGEQSHYSLPKVAAGVYLLRLSSNQQVKIQKIILQ